MLDITLQRVDYVDFAAKDGDGFKRIIVDFHACTKEELSRFKNPLNSDSDTSHKFMLENDLWMCPDEFDREGNPFDFNIYYEEGWGDDEWI